MKYLDKGNRFDEPVQFITYEKGIYNEDGKFLAKGTYKNRREFNREFPAIGYTNTTKTYTNGKRKEVKAYSTNGGGLQSLRIGASITYCYDRTGKEIARLPHSPNEGKKITYLVDKKTERQFNDGKLTAIKYFDENGRSIADEIYGNNGRKEETEYYPTGEKMKVILQEGEVGDKTIIYYQKDGRVMGKLTH